ncbi:ABC transporter permease [Candidatus Clostridium radicumherbarum]|uniref:ABC transporter permease n=1 Tax=Candidatus Clostridium radicumherbarum TaxID=3381662 RepID=A0ABW8TR51_9CLOT
MKSDVQLEARTYLKNKKSKVPSFLEEMRKNYALYIMMLPAMIVIFLLCYLPLPGIIIAFKNYNVVDNIFGSPWCGLDNFKFFFTSQYALRTTLNTLWINFWSLLMVTIVSVTFAIMLNELRSKRLAKFYQNAMFLPYFFSTVIVGQIINMVVFPDGNGIANQIVSFLGMEHIKWSSTPGAWVKIIVGSSLWSTVGYNVIIYLASIVGIDDQLYEAAQLDGASRWKQIIHITIPMLVPAIIMLLLLNIGKMMFGDFSRIYSIIGDNGQLFAKTDIIETYIFRGIRQSADFSISTAVGLYQSIVGFILVYGSNALVKRYDKDYALF